MFCHCSVLFIVVLCSTAEEFLGEYGWYVLFLTICVIVLIHYLSKKRASQVNRGASNERAQGESLFEVPC